MAEYRPFVRALAYKHVGMKNGKMCRKDTMIRVLGILLISLLAQFGLAQTLTEGTEILITDPSSEVILGYGVVLNDRLELQLAFDTRDVVLLFIQPDGGFSTQTGTIDSDGRLNVTDAQGRVSELSAVLDAQSLGLELSYTDTGSFEGEQSSDDEVLGPPADTGKPDDTPGLGREGAPGQGGDNPGRRDDNPGQNPGQGGGNDDNPGRGGGNDDNPGQGGGNDDNPGRGGGNDDNPGQGGGNDDNPGRGGGNDDNPGRGGGNDDNPGRGGGNDDNPGQGGGNQGGGNDDDPGQGRPPGRGN